MARIIELHPAASRIAFTRRSVYIPGPMRKSGSELAVSARQGEFPFAQVPRTKTAVLEYLSAGGGATVHLTITRNRVSMVAVSRSPGGVTRVRLQEAFLSAPDEVLDALRIYLRSRTRIAWETVSAYAQQITPAGGAREQRLRTRGHVYDLDEIGAAVNAEFFDGRLKYRIGWSRAPKRRSRRARSIRFGSWDPHTQTIRVHPRLDDSRVPGGFIRYIVFHEMLHAVVQPVPGKGGRRDHPAEFRVLERRFPDLPGMKRMARVLLDIL